MLGEIFKLKELIWELERLNQVMDPDTIIPIGIGNPHSYRGYYERLAFEPVVNTTLRGMLTCAKEAFGETFDGWKGGRYQMGGDTWVHIAHHGDTGLPLTPQLLEALVGTKGTTEPEW